jgi:hypothetical protein
LIERWHQEWEKIRLSAFEGVNNFADGLFKWAAGEGVLWQDTQGAVPDAKNLAEGFQPVGAAH